MEASPGFLSTVVRCRRW